MKEEGTVQKTTIGGLTAYHYGVRPVQPTSPEPVVVASASGPTGPPPLTIPQTLEQRVRARIVELGMDGEILVSGGPSGPSRKVPVNGLSWWQRFKAWFSGASVLP